MVKKKRVTVRVSLDNNIDIIYFERDGKGDIIEKKDSFVAEDIVSCITELYVLHVLKQQDFIEDMILVFSEADFYVNEIFKLGIVIGSLSCNLGEDIKIELL